MGNNLSHFSTYELILLIILIKKIVQVYKRVNVFREPTNEAFIMYIK